MRCDGTRPLYRACENLHESIVKHVLDNKANLNICTKIGASPLYGACENGYIDAVQLLLNSRAEMN